MIEEVVYDLNVPINYAFKGVQTEAKFITLKAPSSRNMSHIAELKQAFYRSLPKNNESNNDNSEADENVEFDGDDIMSIITASNNVELSSVLLTARELLTSKDIAYVDGEEKLTKPIIESMNPDDYYDLVGVYLANFILASVLQKMKKNLSQK